MTRWAFALWAWVAMIAPSWADAPRPFGADSLEAILRQHAGRPFVLSLWSANGCSHCLQELAMLGQMAKARPDLALVLVAVDAPEFSASIERIQGDLGLARFESWVFADAIPDRLRYAIDPKWFGEIPRTYLYDAAHRRESVAGVLSAARLGSWLDRQGLIK